MALQAFRDRLYVIGGEDLGTRSVLSESQRYSPAENLWVRLPSVPNAVHGVASAVVGDAIYLFGGSRAAASGQGTDLVQRLAF
jgi:hypothetical protein